MLIGYICGGMVQVFTNFTTQEEIFKTTLEPMVSTGLVLVVAMRSVAFFVPNVRVLYETTHCRCFLPYLRSCIGYLTYNS